MGVVNVSWRILVGDCREQLRTLEAGNVQTCITSPPYFGLRDYGTEGQIGLEPTPDEFVTALVEVFREVRRVLRDDGTVWINLGDSYQSNPGSGYANGDLGGLAGRNSEKYKATMKAGHATKNVPRGSGKPKDLLGIPWLVAFALRADGWYLRSDVIWNKPNPMPESVTDRPTKSHEYLFLLSKGPRYFYDADAIREEHEAPRDIGRLTRTQASPGDERERERRMPNEAGRNKRSVWSVATQPFSGAHFATFPPKLVEPCVLAGSAPKACGVCGTPWKRVVERGESTSLPVSERKGRVGHNGSPPQQSGWFWQQPESRTVGWESSCPHDDDTGSSAVLDPFAGSGTVGVVCGWHGREFIGIELSPEYAAMARDRITAEGKPWRPKSQPPKVSDDQMGFLFEVDQS